VRAALVVGGDEGCQLGLELGDGGGRRLPGQPFLEGLLESFDFALGLGMARLAVLLPDPEAAQFGLQAVAAALAARQPGSELLAVEFLMGVKWFGWSS
jgi:hypothetical protein